MTPSHSELRWRLRRVHRHVLFDKLSKFLSFLLKNIMDLYLYETLLASTSSYSGQFPCASFKLLSLPTELLTHRDIMH
jgi:hypothetical protein